MGPWFLPLQGQGCWNTLEPLQPWQGLSVTLDATPSSYDQRSQAWIFALCVHTFSLNPAEEGNHYGHGTRSTDQSPRAVPAPHQLGHVLTPINVIVQLGSVWEAWTNPRKRKGFEDLAKGFEEDLFRRITPLYIRKNAPGSEPHLRRRQPEAALAAYERASTIYDQHAESWQRTLDQDHLQIYKQAAARLEKIYKDPQHYTKSQSAEQGATPSSTRSGSSTSASSRGSPTSTSGNLTGVVFNATRVIRGCTKL